MNSIGPSGGLWNVGAERSVSMYTPQWVRGISGKAWAERWSVVEGGDGTDLVIGSLRKTGCHFLLMRDAKGVCIGMLDLHIEGRGSAEIGLIVASDRQRRGYGTLMVQEAIRFARSLDLNELVIHVRGEGIEMLARKLLFERDTGCADRYVFPLKTLEWELNLADDFKLCVIY